MSKREMGDREIIDAYFNDPRVREMLDRELGPPGKIKVDWKKRTVIARGSFQGKKWNLDEMLTDLRNGLKEARE